MTKSLILDIYNSKKTVFSIKDIGLLWRESNTKLLKNKIYEYVKANKLYSIRKGFYARNKEYDRYELATKIYTPAYISFETVLSRAGVIFQNYNQIFISSYLSREIKVDEQKYVYRKIKDLILINDTGIIQKNNYSIATPERAFLDMLYLNKNYHFDNLSVLNWDKVLKILPIYSSKRMEQEIKNYTKKYDVNHNYS